MLWRSRLAARLKTPLFRNRWQSSFSRGRYDPFNALTVRWDEAQGGEGALSGWSVSIKENIAMKGVPTTCSSKMLESMFEILIQIIDLLLMRLWCARYGAMEHASPRETTAMSLLWEV